jgi:hypothetical protein
MMMKGKKKKEKKIQTSNKKSYIEYQV